MARLGRVGSVKAVMFRLGWSWRCVAGFGGAGRSWFGSVCQVWLGRGKAVLVRYHGVWHGRAGYGGHCVSGFGPMRSVGVRRSRRGVMRLGMARSVKSGRSN